MGQLKRRWFETVERLEEAYLELGVDRDRAYQLATEVATRQCEAEPSSYRVITAKRELTDA
jgi:hypothetical protein